jgi:hydrogenase-4 component B
MTNLLLAAYASTFALALLGAIAALAFPSRARILLAWFSLAASLAALAAGTVSFFVPDTHVSLWALPAYGPLLLKTTPLGAFSTCIAALIYVPVSIYSGAYLRRYEGAYSVTSFALWYFLLFASVIAVFVCADLVSFFVVWEIAAIASAALVAFEWRDRSCTRAAYLMLAMTEAGTAAAILAMLIVFANSGSYAFASGAGAHLPPQLGWCAASLALFGFGVKAGLAPVNSWLPRAYPVAPANVSTILSAIVVNLGVYGILLVNVEFAPLHSPAFGALMLAIGAVSALLGILYASVSDDAKTVLAYSSIENLGIVVAGMGAGLVFLDAGKPAFAALGFAAALYHLLNHSTYKALLFLGIGVVDTQTGTRSIDRMGGLIRLLPATAACVLIGCLAISAIPPLNGFTSEWLTLQSLLRSAELASVGMRVTFALSGAVLALTAALAITTFVKMFGMIFLGVARTNWADRSITEAPLAMRAAMYLLAAACVLLGIGPTYVLGIVDRALRDLSGSIASYTLVPGFFSPYPGRAPLPADFVATFHALGAQVGMHVVPGHGLVVMLRGGSTNPVVFAMSTTYLCLILLVLFTATYAGVRLAARGRLVQRALAWAGGLRVLAPSMTYTGTGFSNPVRVIFEAVFQPGTNDERETVQEHFRTAIRRERRNDYIGDRLVIAPATRAVQWSARLLARMHHGHLNAYVLYALFTLLLALGIMFG